MKFCTKCGKELVDEAVICPGCGVAQGEAAKPVAAKSNSGATVSIIGFVISLVSLIINPLYLCNIAAIVLGIIGVSSRDNNKKGFAIAAIIIAVVTFLIQFIFDLILSIFTFGASFFI